MGPLESARPQEGGFWWWRLGKRKSLLPVPCPTPGPSAFHTTALLPPLPCGFSTCLPQGDLQPVLLRDGEPADEFPAIFQLLHLDLQPPGIHAAPTLPQLTLCRAPQRPNSHRPSAQLRLEGLLGPREEASLLGVQAAQPFSPYLSTRLGAPGLLRHTKASSPRAL